MSFITDLMVDVGPCEVKISTYDGSDRTKFKLNCKDGSPFATLSVNLDDSAFKPDQLAAVNAGEIFAVKDYSENEGLLEHFIQIGVIEAVGYTSGNPIANGIYPLARLVDTSADVSN